MISPTRPISDATPAPIAGERAALAGDTRSARKHSAILDAATEVFLREGYLGANMDKIAARSGVSKQTIYKHFTSKEALFTAIVGGMTTTAGDLVHHDVPVPSDRAALGPYLEEYAARQLLVVLTPRLMQLRRLVIGEVGRFPELARVLYEAGPQRAIGTLAAMFAALAERGLLALDDPHAAAVQFNWLVMGEAINRAMLLGDAGIPPPAALREHAASGVRVFLAAYGSPEQGAAAAERQPY